MWFFEGKTRVVGGRGHRNRCYSRWLEPDNRLIEGAAQYGSLVDFIQRQRPERVGILRSIGLGDLLMLIAVCRAMHRALGLVAPITLIVRRDMALAFGAMNDDTLRFVAYRGKGETYGCQVLWDANHCLAPDHRGPPASDYHRCRLYGRAMGFTDVVGAKEGHRDEGSKAEAPLAAVG